MKFLKENRNNLYLRTCELQKLENDIASIAPIIRLDEILQKEYTEIEEDSLHINCIKSVMDTLTDEQLKCLDLNLLNDLTQRMGGVIGIVTSDIKSPERKETDILSDIFHWISCAAFEAQNNKPAYPIQRVEKTRLMRDRYPEKDFS